MENSKGKNEKIFDDKIANTNISKDKKSFLKWENQQGRTDMFYMISFMELLEDKEHEYNKQLYEFTEDEYLSLYTGKAARASRSMSLTFSDYLSYLSIKKNEYILDCPAFKMKFAEISRKRGDRDHRYFTQKQFDEICWFVRTYSNNPVYDEALLLCIYRGISFTNGVMKMTIDDLDVDKCELHADDVVYKIDKRLTDLLFKCSKLEGIHTRFDKWSDFIPSNRIFKMVVEHKNELAEKQYFSRRVTRTIGSRIDEYFDSKINASNIKYSGCFNYLNNAAYEKGYSLIYDVVNKSETHTNFYNDVLSEYKGKYSKGYYYSFKGDYKTLCVSMMNNIDYEKSNFNKKKISEIFDEQKKKEQAVLDKRKFKKRKGD